MYKTNEDKVKDRFVKAEARCDTMRLHNKWSIWSSGIKISNDCVSKIKAWKSAKDLNGIK